MFVNNVEAFLMRCVRLEKQTNPFLAKNARVKILIEKFLLFFLTVVENKIQKANPVHVAAVMAVHAAAAIIKLLASSQIIKGFFP